MLPHTLLAHSTDFERPATQDEGPTEQPSTSGTPRPTVYELIWHASDSSVKPIVANRRIERLPEPKWDAQALPFRPLVSSYLLMQASCSCLASLLDMNGICNAQVLPFRLWMTSSTDANQLCLFVVAA